MQSVICQSKERF